MSKSVPQTMMKKRQNNPRSRGPRPRKSRLPEDRRNEDIEKLLHQAQPTFSCFHLEEPLLVFNGNHTTVDPKEGLELFGPVTMW